MPGNPNLIVPLASLLKKSDSNGGGNKPSPSPTTPPKTLEEIATNNKQKGEIAFDFQDVTDILEGKKDNELVS